MIGSGKAGRIFVGRQREIGELRTALDESIGGHRRPGHAGGGTGNRQDPYSPRIVRGGRDLWGASLLGLVLQRSLARGRLLSS
jgi:hypothetical protein